MQTFNLDLSNKLIQPLLNAKQGEVGRMFRAVITDGGVEFLVQDVVRFSVWYSGEGGAGNYTDIGGRSAFSIDGNTVIVELITEMLNLPGKGELCLTMDIGGVVMATWNIPYFVEAVPGAGSKTATQYFNIMKESAERAAASAQEADDSARRAEQAVATLETDKSLSAPGVAADAAATGEKIAAVMQDVTGNREKLMAANIVCDAEGELVTLSDASDLPLVGLKIFGKTTQNGTPTPDNPVELVDLCKNGTVKVYVRGKNLFDASRGFEFGAYQPLFIPAGTYITLSVFPTDGTANINYKIRYTDGTESGAASLVSNLVENNVWYTKTIKASKATRSVTIYHSNPNGSYTKRTVGKAMVRLGNFSTTTDADYEAFNGQELTLSTPNGLPGIPVATGGDYTDAKGQQWLAHIAGYEQDGQIGELKTTGHIESYAGEAITGAYLSSTGALDVGASVRYALETPEFAPYDAETQAQWRAMHTNKLNTTIYNDAGTGMEASYVADTKAYIDNKFAELAAAVVNNT